MGAYSVASSRIYQAAVGRLLEHARHQAARLALKLSQLPALAEGLGDVMLANPDRSQAALPTPHLSSRQAGFDAFLAKSCTEQKLISMIEHLSTVRFESAVNDQRTPAPSGMADWPDALADATAREITAAVDLGDIARLFEIADALPADPAAPRADVENMALMARMFDFDGLRALSERLQQRSPAEAGA